jgi:hypothetical protein
VHLVPAVLGPEALIALGGSLEGFDLAVGAPTKILANLALVSPTGTYRIFPLYVLYSHRCVKPGHGMQGRWHQRGTLPPRETCRGHYKLVQFRHVTLEYKQLFFALQSKPQLFPIDAFGLIVERRHR